MKILVLASGAGSTLKNTLGYQIENKPKWSIAGLVTDNPKALALDVARLAKIPAIIVSQKDFSSFTSWGNALAGAIENFQPDLIFLMGFLKKIDSATVDKFKNKMVNTHPSLLPKFGGQGMYGRKVHDAVLAAREKSTGVSIHFVTDDYDTGPVLAQAEIEVADGESAAELESRVKALEQRVIIEFLNRCADGPKSSLHH